MDESPPLTIGGLGARLGALTLRDEQRLGRRLDGLRSGRDPGRRTAALGRLAADVEVAERRVAARRAAVPALHYPEQLPVSQRHDELLAALQDHQVVVVAGETGSGKTTQLPKMLLEAGRGVRGMIGHTQPRRIAARAVAERLSEELGTPLGGAVGYQVRFTDQVSDTTLIKLMTDGVLLAEVQRDRTLLAYDTIIIDEAHERSLTIDFLLGLLSRLLPRRPDLKVVVMSATIDPQRFAAHLGGAPVVEVSGRTFPVEVRYRPLVAELPETEDRDPVQGVVDAVDELATEGPGDVLVFLSGEREIRDTADALLARDLARTEVVPLYARLSAAEQHRVFEPHTGRRIVLATNVAETSLTVPGIRYVVDPGTARISRLNRRTGVQRLPIEAISRASAGQRAGRCGRVADGICIRLYSGEDLLSRNEFTDPEILRTGLGAVILQMASLGLGEVTDFPFLDPPDRRAVADGVRLLEELGALRPGADGSGGTGGRLTELGRRLARLPVDPRLGRMLLESQAQGCTAELLVIVSGLSIQDPRERPVDKPAQAAELHGRFTDGSSDATPYLALWRYLREQQEELSSSAFRRMCKREMLSWLRVREWQDLHGQLRRVARELGLEVLDQPADAAAVHRAMLAGLLAHVGTYDADRRDYLGARGARFAINPGSALVRKHPRWVAAAALVETTRLWARGVIPTDPLDVERIAPEHLLVRSLAEPHWSRRRGAAAALERVTMLGLPLVTGRRTDLARHDPALARELFIRHALVEDDWETHHRFAAENRRLLAEVAELGERLRRSLEPDGDALVAFFDQRVPVEATGARAFDAWWKTQRHRTPDLLTYPRALLVPEEPDADSHPDRWQVGDLALPLSYAHAPGKEEDGVTVLVPVAVLDRLRDSDFSWEVPGLRHELVTALLRGLPKDLRRSIGPAPDAATLLLARLGDQQSAADREPLLDALARELRRATGVVVPRAAWRPDALPEHLRVGFSVRDDDDHELARGRDLAALQAQLRPQARQAIAAATGLERERLQRWDFGDLPRTVSRVSGGLTVVGYPSLVAEQGGAAVRVLGTAAEQAAAMPAGTRRLLQQVLPSPVKGVQRRLALTTQLALSRSPHGSAAELLIDCSAATLDALVVDAGGPAWDQVGFERLRDVVRPRLDAALLDTVTRVADVLAAVTRVEARVDGLRAPALLASVADMRAQLTGLVHPGFVAEVGVRRLRDLERYLTGLERRLDGLATDPQRDIARTARVQAEQVAYEQWLAALTPSDRARPEVAEVQWMLEELRLSLFAQGVRTAYPISEQRIARAMEAVG